jgi:hypothetical protein
MTDNELAASQKVLVEGLAKLDSKLSVLALVALVDEFYTKDERRSHYAEREGLCQQCARSYAAMDAARLKTEPSGSEVPGARDEFNRLKDLKVEADAAYGRFRHDHALIERLIEVKAKLSKGRYES